MSPAAKTPPPAEEPEEVEAPEVEAEAGDGGPDWQEERASLLADFRKEAKEAFGELLGELDAESQSDGNGSDGGGIAPAKPAANGGAKRGRQPALPTPEAASGPSLFQFLLGQRRPAQPRK